MLPRGWDLEQGALMVKRIRSLISWVCWWISHGSCHVSVESSFITRVSNSVLDGPYDHVLKHGHVLLLFSLWVFWAGGSSESLVPLSQCSRGGRQKSVWLTWITDYFAMAVIQFLREEYAFMQNALLAIRLMPWKIHFWCIQFTFIWPQISVWADEEPVWADLSFKGIRNYYLDIRKLSAAQRIFLTLKQGLCEHPFLLSGVVVCLCN